MSNDQNDPKKTMGTDFHYEKTQTLLAMYLEYEVKT